MNMNKLVTGIATSVFIFGAVIAPAIAHSSHDEGCDVSLNYDVVIEPQKLVLSQGDAEAYRVDHGKLFVNGEQVELNAKQRKILNTYVDEVSTQVPEVIEVVNEAVSLATEAVTMAFTPLFGEQTSAKFEGLMEGISERIEGVAYQHGDKFYLGATEDSVEEAFNEEFEKEIESLVQNSLGSMMMALGGQMLSSDGDSFEQKMEAFGEKMESIGDDIEKQFELQGQNLEYKADKLCENFERLLVIEAQMRDEIPQLNKFPLADSDSYSSLM